MNPPDPQSPPSADLAPLSPGRRLWLLTILVVLPFAAVCVPAALVFHFSGRQGTFASWGKGKGEPDVSGLRGSLEITAQKDLPAPDALDPGAIDLHSAPERLAARVAKIMGFAQQLGGSATEGLPADGAKHLFVELPAGRGAAFRELVKGGSPTPEPVGVAPVGKEHLEVVIHTEDE